MDKCILFGPRLPKNVAMVLAICLGVVSLFRTIALHSQNSFRIALELKKSAHLHQATEDVVLFPMNSLLFNTIFSRSHKIDKEQYEVRILFIHLFFREKVKLNLKVSG